MALLKSIKPDPGEIELAYEDKKKLLILARKNIVCAVNNMKLNDQVRKNISKNLKKHYGVFVSIYKKNNLKGCIGRLIVNEPVYKTVQEMAASAATQDFRFSKVKPNELDKLNIEISILSSLKRIKSMDEIILSKHGIYIVKGNSTGTFLPQVADKNNWTKEEFVSNCASQKLGIGKNDWMDAELYVYTALVFRETDIFN